MKGFGVAIGVLFMGAAGGFIVRAIIDALVVGTSVGENMNTYLIPAAIFVSIIVTAFFAMFNKKKPKEP